MRGKREEMDPADVRRWIAELDRMDRASSPEEAAAKAAEVKALKAAARLKWRERLEREAAEAERAPRRGAPGKSDPSERWPSSSLRVREEAFDLP